MAKFEQIRDRLPSLYRPQIGDRTPQDNRPQTQLTVIVTHDNEVATANFREIEAAIENVLVTVNAQSVEAIEQSFTYAELLTAVPLPALPEPEEPEPEEPEAEIAGPYQVQFLITQADQSSYLLTSETDPAYAIAPFERITLSDVKRGPIDELYQADNPPPADASLMARLLQAVGTLLDQVDTETALVLQSHWFPYADRALHDPFFRRRLALTREPVPTANDASLLTFPYINELAYLGALLSLSPWQDPPELKESSEAYRLRIRRTVDLYRQGLGTVGALARMVEAQLPIDLTLEESLRDRPFWIEETVPATAPLFLASGRGAPEALVGPLMRWSMENSGQVSVVPTVYIQGIAPEAGELDPTAQPMIERYQGSGSPVGLAYAGTLAAGETLRIRPAFHSWLGTDSGLLRAIALPTETEMANPTAPGPWAAIAEGPTGTVVAIATAEDATIWVAANEGDSGQLWRYDGATWSTPIDTGALGQLHCLQMHRQTLWIGSDTGLHKLPLFPVDNLPSLTLSLLENTPVYTVYEIENRYWLGTQNGAFILQTGETDETVEATDIQNVPVYALLFDAGVIYLGNQLGLIQHQTSTKRWFWYSGAERSDQQPEWIGFDPTTDPLPAESSIFLPPVRALARTADSSLWMGTDNGLARYIARSVRELSYETSLEAFPEMTTGSVKTMRIDARSLLWIGTDRGLLRYDGRNLWQLQGESWQALGKADRIYEAAQLSADREGWRFNRAAEQWERFGTPVAADFRTTVEAAVSAIAWTDSLAADQGSWDGSTFTANSELDIDQFQTQYKPRPTEIVTGGPAAIPKLPVGASTWRYLQRESDPPNEPADRPAWTHEGRLLPPPPDTEVDPESGRYDLTLPPPPSNFDSSVFAFNPAAKVWLQWPSVQPRVALVRLSARSPGEQLDPVVVDRLWQQIQIVRPVGVQIQLALEETILKGKE